jgi:hypothetical protein
VVVLAESHHPVGPITSGIAGGFVVPVIAIDCGPNGAIIPHSAQSVLVTGAPHFFLVSLVHRSLALLNVCSVSTVLPRRRCAGKHG